MQPKYNCTKHQWSIIDSRLAFLIIFCFFYRESCAQVDVKKNPNRISFFNSAHFFSRDEKKSLGYPIPLLFPGFGFEYERRIGKQRKHYLSLHCDWASIVYRPSNPHSFYNYLDVSQREMQTFGVWWKYPLFQKHGVTVKPMVSAQLRMGSETVVVADDGGWELLVFTRGYLDPQISAGLEVENQFHKHFCALASASYSRVIYRYDDGSESNYPNDKGSPKASVGYHLGLGFMF